MYNWYMSPDQYLQNVINAKLHIPIQLSDYRLNNIIYLIRSWGGSYIREIKLSGSSAKNLVVSGESDVDIFISLKSDTPFDLKTIYSNLVKYLRGNSYPIVERMVAIQTSANSLKIDIVPGKVQSGFQNWHSLYNSDTGNWLQTNIDAHIDTITKSGRLDEIRIIKIWCHNHLLKFPSIYLELIVLDALYNRNKNQLVANVWTVLEYLCDNFINRRVVDLSNTNNIISDYALSASQKKSIANKASECLKAQYWEQIVW